MTYFTITDADNDKRVSQKESLPIELSTKLDWIHQTLCSLGYQMSKNPFKNIRFMPCVTEGKKCYTLGIYQPTNEVLTNKEFLNLFSHRIFITDDIIILMSDITNTDELYNEIVKALGHKIYIY